jgi:two-component sensor histidine kinase
MHPAHLVHLAHRPPNRRATPIARRIETGGETNTLRFQCPNAGREVDSGVSTLCDGRLLSIRVRCPICEDLHECRVADGSLGALLSADDGSNDGQLNKAPEVLQVFHGASAEIIELREQLLDELNHRLKNNLQVLYGLLKVAWRKTDNAEAREVLSDTCRRIGAMGSAQQVFYSARSSTDVSGQKFLEAVCANAKAFLSEDVSIKYGATSGFLPKETAVPLALILNELLTNAAKYGADDCGRIAINVGLRHRSGEIELYVQDRGSGFNFEEARGQSSGLGLVAMLAQRLRGTFTVDRRSGRCILRFPDQ